jgi:carbonic anhydrase
MQDLNKLIANNKAWASEMLALDPEFFAKREEQQQPTFLMIGCSDSRVPLELMTGALPGEMFVHRNIGNQVWSTDFKVLSVLHFAVQVLQVKHIIVCGHSTCGALQAADGNDSLGILDHWLSDIRNTIRWNRAELDACRTREERYDRLSELNVKQQLGMLSRTPTVLDAWSRGRRPMLHGWVYDIGTGLVKRVVEAVDSVEHAAKVLPNN